MRRVPPKFGDRGRRQCTAMHGNARQCSVDWAGLEAWRGREWRVKECGMWVVCCENECFECVWKHRDGNCGGRKRRVGRGRQWKEAREEFKCRKSGECVERRSVEGPFSDS